MGVAISSIFRNKVVDQNISDETIEKLFEEEIKNTNDNEALFSFLANYRPKLMAKIFSNISDW